MKQIKQFINNSDIIVNNPWTNIDPKPPFVFESDRRIIDVHNNNPRTNENHKIHTELYPEPFLGNPEASVVLLNLNPGFSINDIWFHSCSKYFIMQARKNLIHESDYGFYLLDPEINEAPGYKWWSKRLRTLIEACGQKNVAQNIFCVELLPYHSTNFKKIESLESQKYSFYLVNNAIKRKAIVILMRGKKLWMESIPNLITYDQCVPLRNPRCVYITEQNLPNGIFNCIVRKINTCYQSSPTDG